MRKIAIILALLMLFSVSVDSKVKKQTTKKQTTTQKAKTTQKEKSTREKEIDYSSLSAEELIEAAKGGDAKAQYFVGCYLVLNEGEKAKKAGIECLQKSANQGYADAQAALGECYLKGVGVTKDAKQAVYWFKKAAEQGNADAQTMLGICYSLGEGVTKDEKQAVYWYKKAADKGNAFGQTMLGECYLKGVGVTKDTKQALYWYKKAADKGNADAQFGLGLCYEKDFDIKQAVYWYKKAAEQGHAKAQANLGLFYYIGEGVTKDAKQAVYWLKKAAEQGVDGAQELADEIGHQIDVEDFLNNFDVDEYVKKYEEYESGHGIRHSSQSDKEIVLERKYLVHHGYRYFRTGGYYCYPSISLVFDNNAGIRIGYINTYYYNTYINKPYTGVHALYYKDIVNDGFTEHASGDWNITPVVLDKWVEEKIIVSLDGHVKYYMNGKYMGEKAFDVGTKLIDASTVTVDVDPYGWWTGHYQYMDDFKIETPAISIRDNFDDGVIDSEIWKTPVNLDGVKEEKGIIKMEQLRTDKDFHLRSVPIPMR